MRTTNGELGAISTNLDGEALKALSKIARRLSSARQLRTSAFRNYKTSNRLRHFGDFSAASINNPSREEKRGRAAEERSRNDVIAFRMENVVSISTEPESESGREGKGFVWWDCSRKPMTQFI